MTNLPQPAAHGRRLAAFFRAAEPRLWRDLAESGAVPGGREREARAEWECLALDACLRGLVAAGDFRDHTAHEVDEFHAAVLEGWAAGGSVESLAVRRERLTARYEEYGRLARGLEAAGAARVSATLGESAATHACAPAAAPAALASVFATMHESLAEGAAAMLRDGTQGA
jgi:hypothetical protein